MSAYESNRAWRLRNPDKRHASKVGYRERTGSGTAPNLRVPWTDAEDEMVLAHAVPDRRIAEQIGRSVQAVQVRRCRLLARAGGTGGA